MRPERRETRWDACLFRSARPFLFGSRGNRRRLHWRMWSSLWHRPHRSISSISLNTVHIVSDTFFTPRVLLSSPSSKLLQVTGGSRLFTESAAGSGPPGLRPPGLRMLSRPRGFGPRPSRGRLVDRSSVASRREVVVRVCRWVWMVVRFVCVIRAPVCARVSRACPVCVPARVFLPVEFWGRCALF